MCVGHVKHLNGKGLDLGELGFQSGKKINTKKKVMLSRNIGIEREKM
jgi:hypothetical protein